MVHSAIWEVVSSRGVIVRVARQLTSPAFEERLSPGSLVKAVRVEGDRLQYNRIAGTGYGPDSGWVSVRAGGLDLLVPSDWEPKSEWKVLEKALPTDWSRPRLQALPAPTPNGVAPEGAPQPQCEQTAGQPFVFLRQVNFADTKPTGFRMSSYLAAMDESRWDLLTICDHEVSAFKHVRLPIVQATLELRPMVAELSQEANLARPEPDCSGICSWLRVETSFGWPSFPTRTEESTVYLVGKHRASKQKVPLCTGRFLEFMLDDGPGDALKGPQSEQDAARFWARVKRDHSSPALDDMRMHQRYPSAGRPFAPTHFQKVRWMMSAVYADLWKLIYHPRIPELLWDLNRLASGPFAALVAEESDPQAIAVELPAKMSFGAVYDAHCFVDEASRKALYLLLPEGSEDAAECVLAVLARYDWSVLPQDGRTLSAEDVEMVRKSRGAAISYGSRGAAPPPTSLLDLSKLPKP